MITLLPRLTASAGERMLDDFLRDGVSNWKAFDANNLPDGVRFAATGGSQATAAQLRSLRSGLIETAVTCGLGKEGSKNEFARFDADAAAWLAENPTLASGEALRDDVWMFIGVAMAPDIVHWRFGPARERYLGGVRNTFQRLWLRARSPGPRKRHRRALEFCCTN